VHVPKLAPFLDTLPDRLAGVTLEQVNAAIRKHLATQNLCIAVITEGADDFLRDIAGNVPSPITYESDVPADISAEDARVAAYRLNVSRADSRVLEADDTFE